MSWLLRIQEALCSDTKVCRTGLSASTLTLPGPRVKSWRNPRSPGLISVAEAAASRTHPDRHCSSSGGAFPRSPALGMPLSITVSPRRGQRWPPTAPPQRPAVRNSHALSPWDLSALLSAHHSCFPFNPTVQGAPFHLGIVSSTRSPTPTPPEPEGTTSGTNPEPGGHPHHHPASPRGGQSCVVNPQKRLGWDKTAVTEFFSRPPNSGTLARIYCQWLRYCCRHLFNLYNTSGANSPLQIPHRRQQPCASLRGGHHVPIPGAGSRGALLPLRGEAIYISTMVHSLGKTGSIMETVTAASRRGTRVLSQNKFLSHTSTLRAFPAV